MTIRRISRQLFTGIAIASIFVSSAIAAPDAPPFKLVCGEKGASSADGKTYWTEFYNSFPVSMPLAGLAAPTLTPAEIATNCSPATAYASFDGAVRACGFGPALSIALSMSRTQFDAWCPDDKAKSCKQLIDARGGLDAMFGGAEPAPSIKSDEYRPKLTVSAPLQDTGIAFYEAIPRPEYTPPVKSPTGETGDKGRPGRVWLALTNLEKFSVECGPQKPPPIEFIPKELRWGKDGESVGVNASTERDYDSAKPAEIAFGFDRGKKNAAGDYEDTLKINAALGWKLPEADLVSSTLYVSLDYEYKADPKKETDNLAVGVYNVFRNRNPLVPQLDVAWITDSEERDSSQWYAAARFKLPGEVFGRFGTPEAVGPLLWSTTAVVDYTHVVRIGDKEKLANVGEVFRAGFDFNWMLAQPLVDLSGWKPKLSGFYKYRDTIGEGPGNADLMQVKLDLLDLKENHASVSVVYDRGENLTSLDPLEATKLTFNLKQ